MKPFSRRITICLLAILISGYIVARAGVRYARGEGGFKLGVDLVGGTILVYEVDTEKLEQESKDPNRKPFDPAEMAAFLKRRIDPADIYNVTIRPVGETRFEIILPTGGAHQALIEEQAWKNLLQKVRAKWPDKLNEDALSGIPPGNERDLVVLITQTLNWEELKRQLRDKYPQLKEEANLKAFNAVPFGRQAELIEAVKKATNAPDDELKKVVEAAGKSVNESE